MVLDAVTIICNCNDAGLDHRPDWCHLFAVQPFRDRAGWEHVNSSTCACPIRDPCDRAWIIRRWFGVWHTNDRGKTAGSCRPTSGLDRFLMGLTWLTQVNVDIDQPRRHDEVARVNNFTTIIGRLSGHPAANHVQVCNLIPVDRWIDNPSISYDQVPHLVFRPAVLHR